MKITYRPEIDGLRAIAVGAVILYHSQITIFGHQPFKGGFFGVDIFFVISGYLITSIILKELITTGAFSFKHFYERRVRRILPALIFVMLVSLPFAWMYLLPDSLVDFSKSILYSLGFGSNFYFHYSGQQYDAQSGLLKPFLHTWSLSVEEQFYILFPIVLLITFKYLRNYLIHVLILGFIISLGLAEWTSRNYPSASFYFLHTRMLELLIGSILAYFEITKGQRSKHQTANLILPSIGLFLIGYFIFFFNNKIPHPSSITLLPVIGVCLVIWFSSKDEIVTKILSSKLFVGVGLISYSLYLWHYPIFAFIRINNFIDANISYKIVLVFSILILSIFSYKYIEQPFRNKKTKFSKIFSTLLALLIILVFFNSSSLYSDGFKKRINTFLLKNWEEKRTNLLKNKDNEDCHGNIKGCLFNSYNKKVILVGDSVANNLSFDLKKKLTERKYSFQVFTMGGCFYFPEYELIEIKTGKPNNYCNYDYISKIDNILKNEKNSIILFVGKYSLYNSGYFFRLNNKKNKGNKWGNKYVNKEKEEDNKHFSNFINSVNEIALQNKIILVYQIPEPHLYVEEEIFKRYPKNNNEFNLKLLNKDFISYPYKDYLQRSSKVSNFLDQIKSDNVFRVFPENLFCDSILKNKCVLHDNKNIFFSDLNHLTSKGSEMIVDLIMKEIEKIESKSY